MCQIISLEQEDLVGRKATEEVVKIQEPNLLYNLSEISSPGALNYFKICKTKFVITHNSFTTSHN